MVAPVLILLAIMSYGGYAIAEGLRVGGRSGIFPLALGVALVALTAVATIRTLRPRATPADSLESEPSPDMAPITLSWVHAAGLALLAAYMLAASYIGLLSAAIVFTPVLGFVGAERRWTLLAAFTAILVLVLYFIFSVFLRLPLPPEFLIG
jgi:hypothetical protein